MNMKLISDNAVIIKRRNITISDSFNIIIPIIFIFATAMQDICDMPAMYILRWAVIPISLLIPDCKGRRRMYIFLLMMTSESMLYWVNICFGVICILKENKKIIINKTTFYVFILLTWEMVHMINLLFFDFSFFIILKQMGFALVLFSFLLFIQQVDVLKEFSGIFKYWIIGVLAACTIFYIKYILRFGIGYAFSFSAGMGKNTSSDILNYTFNKDPNMVSRLCGVSISLLVVMIILSKKLDLEVPKIKYGLLIIVITFFGMVSGAMSFYMMLGICLISTILFSYKDLPKVDFLKFLFVVLIALIVFAILVYAFLPNAMSRVSNDLMDADISSGRFDLWRSCVEILIKNPYILLFGVGLQDYHKKIALWFQLEEMVLHNVLFEIIVSWGIVGMGIFILFLRSLIKEKTASIVVKPPLLAYVPSIVMFVVFLTGNFLYGYYMNFSFLTITLLFAFYIASVNNLKKKEGGFESKHYNLPHTL